MPGVRHNRSNTTQSLKKSTSAGSTTKSRFWRKVAKADNDNSEPSISSPDDDSDVYEGDVLSGGDEDDDDAQSMDSDALDDEVIDKSRKRKRASPMKKTLSKKLSSKKKKKDASEESEDDFELKEGQEVVGTVVQAPKTGRGMYASDNLFL